jgi:hypothetical protein
MTDVPQNPGRQCPCGWTVPRLVAAFQIEDVMLGNLSKEAILPDVAICVRCPMCDERHTYARTVEVVTRLEAVAPPGAKCAWCDEELPLDMPSPITMHPECAIRAIMGSVVHQQRGEGGDCDRSCVDDPTLTKREAAKAAAEETVRQMAARGLRL